MISYRLAIRLSVAVVAICHIAQSQEQSGTIVVFSVAPDYAVIAADSRSTHTCPPAKGTIIDNNDCKIVAFDNQYIVAFSGRTGRYYPCTSNHLSWNTPDIVKSIYQHGNITSVDDFANKLAQKMKAVLTEDFKLSPPEPGRHGIVFGAVVAGGAKGEITAAVAVLRVGKGPGVVYKVETISPSERPNSFGVNDLIKEFNANETKNAKLWHRRMDHLALDDRIIALANLVKNADTSGTVGGKIDSVRLTPFGMDWISVKPQCRKLN